MLEERLRLSLGGRKVEVVNTAMAAVNTYALVDQAEEIVRHEPDAVLVYVGHNEYYGALGVASTQRLAGRPQLVRLYLRLQRFRLVQLLRGALGALLSSSQTDRPERGRMWELSRSRAIRYGSTLYQAGISQFRSNLGELLRAYGRRGIPVFVGTLAANERDLQPFMGGPSEDSIGARAVVRELRRALEAGDRTEVDRLLTRISEKDDLSAQAHFEVGRLLDRYEHYRRARVSFVSAKDRDELRFRAPEAFNQVVLEEARRADAYVVDVNDRLAQASPSGIIGREVMLEHVHPNVDGYLHIADAFYEALSASGVVGGWSRHVSLEEARSHVLLTPVDSLVGMYHVQSLMTRWPFTDNEAESFRLQKPGGMMEQLATGLFLGQLSWLEANLRLERHFVRSGASRPGTSGQHVQGCRNCPSFLTGTFHGPYPDHAGPAGPGHRSSGSGKGIDPITTFSAEGPPAGLAA